ncbi:MAG: phage terminase large subunit family protein, partial [Pseudoxanthomonas sp.]
TEWADAHRVLAGTASAEPGRWRTARVPYMAEIMDCLSPEHPCTDVVLMKGTQVGGTEVGNNWIGYVIHVAPGPMMLVLPTVEAAKRSSKSKRPGKASILAPVLARMIVST